MLDWPASSPDANLTENLWRRLRKYCPSNLKELKSVKTEVWVSVSPKTCWDLIGLIQEQMNKIVNIKRCYIKA